MTKPFGFEKPVGMRDTLPPAREVKESLRQTIASEFAGWGYRFVETPTLEYFDTVGQATAISEHHLFKLLDAEGRTLVLRPDLTAPIARLAASTREDEALPLRFAYDANVFRAQQREGGHPSEFEQIGVELIGDQTVTGDAEVIALLAAVLQKSGVGQFQIALGHIGYVNTLLQAVTGRDGEAQRLKRFLYEKNHVGYREYVRSLSLAKVDEDRLLQLLELRGESECLQHAEALIDSEQRKNTVGKLASLYHYLTDYGVGDRVVFDLTLVNHMEYYTGIVFEGYAHPVGFPLCNGGRYDELLARFGRPLPATGFGIFFDRLLEAACIKRRSQMGRTCIIYSKDRHEEAVRLAQKRRAKGEVVVLQNRSGIKNEDSFLQSFAQIVDCTTGAQKGE